MAARAFQCGAILTHVHGFTDEWVDDIRGEREGVYRTAGAVLCTNSDHIAVNSEATLRFVLKCCSEMGDRVDVVPYGVDPDVFLPSDRRSPGSMEKDDVVIGFIGRLTRQKGLATLIDAVRILSETYSNFRLLVIGDGPLKAQLEAHAASSVPGRIQFLGERFDIPDLLAGFDILAVPSEWEPLGIVCLEAMATAVPVVAFAVDGIPEVIVHGETGVLVKPADVKGFAAALGHLIRDSSQRRRMGAAGRRRVESKFTLSASTRQVETLYETLAFRRSKRMGFIAE